MAERADITPELCRQLLRYEPEVGKLYWLHRPGQPGSWNSRYVGSEAFTCIGPKGYKIGRIFDMLFKAHRVAWAVQHGRWPDGVIDHINGDVADNRLCNLRDVPNEVNLRNARRRIDNASGVAGVYWNKAIGKWTAGARTAPKVYKHLGCFSTREEAISARTAHNAANGFTERHGRAS